MRRDLSLPLLPVPWPEGATLTTLTADLAPACRQLMNAVYAEGYGDQRPFEEWWQWLIADADYDPQLCYVALEGDKVVGFCHSWAGPFIKDLVVAANWRRRGLGASLLTTALATYAKRGAPFVDLKTDVENTKAQSLYRRLGFAIVEQVG